MKQSWREEKAERSACVLLCRVETLDLLVPSTFFFDFVVPSTFTSSICTY
jgi:hypothetical protein